MVKDTAGLSIYEPRETLSDVVGLANVKEYLERKLTGRGGYKAVVFIDEIEKAMAGATSGTSDTSGTSQRVLGRLLSYMQDTESSGVLFLGHPGTGKSLVCKAAGASAGVLTIQFDLAALYGSLVGQTEGRVAQALAVISELSDGKPVRLGRTAQAKARVVDGRRDQGVLSNGVGAGTLAGSSRQIRYAGGCGRSGGN